MDMTEVGVRELKRRATELLRRVREEKEIIIITYRGRAVARLTPAEYEEGSWEEVWREIDELAQEIGKHLPPGTSATHAVREQRREL